MGAPSAQQGGNGPQCRGCEHKHEDEGEQRVGRDRHRNLCGRKTSPVTSSERPVRDVRILPALGAGQDQSGMRCISSRMAADSCERSIKAHDGARSIKVRRIDRSSLMQESNLSPRKSKRASRSLSRGPPYPARSSLSVFVRPVPLWDRVSGIERATGEYSPADSAYTFDVTCADRVRARCNVGSDEEWPVSRL